MWPDAPQDPPRDPRVFWPRDVVISPGGMKACGFQWAISPTVGGDGNLWFGSVARPNYLQRVLLRVFLGVYWRRVS